MATEGIEFVFLAPEYPVKVRIAQTGLPPCARCGGPQVAVLEVTATGSIFGAEYEHVPTCASLVCPHGAWDADECKGCQEEKREQGAVLRALAHEVADTLGGRGAEWKGVSDAMSRVALKAGEAEDFRRALGGLLNTTLERLPSDLRRRIQEAIGAKGAEG